MTFSSLFLGVQSAPEMGPSYETPCILRRSFALIVSLRRKFRERIYRHNRTKEWSALHWRKFFIHSCISRWKFFESKLPVSPAKKKKKKNEKKRKKKQNNLYRVIYFPFVMFYRQKRYL